MAIFLSVFVYTLPSLLFRPMSIFACRLHRLTEIEKGFRLLKGRNEELEQRLKKIEESLYALDDEVSDVCKHSSIEDLM